MNVVDTWALFDEIGAAVSRAVARADRRADGERRGQYRLDLDADAAAVQPLVDAGFAVLSEESGLHGAGREVCVVVDPVDGSTNASRDLPCWATSMCAVDDQGPLVATVIDFTRGVTYRAARGEGATRNGAPISVGDPVSLDTAILGINGWSTERPGCRQYRALGSAAIELCLVAEGALDGYINLELDAHGSWDYLGGLLVLVEAGGVAVDRDGRDLVTIEHEARRTVAAASCEPLLAEMMSR